MSPKITYQKDINPVEALLVMEDRISTPEYSALWYIGIILIDYYEPGKNSIYCMV